MKYKRAMGRILALILALALVMAVNPPNSVSAANTAWQMNDDTEIFWAATSDSEAAYADLAEQVQLFSAELAEKVTDTVLPISYGDVSKAGENDIIIIMDSSLGIGAQGYEVTPEASRLKVFASDADGLFYGCRYVIQQLLINGSVAAGADSPDVPERALSLDIGRKYYSKEWIERMIKELSWSNMNAIVLHFSEEMGLGIESTTYPWLAGRDGTLCTQAEVATDNRYLTQHELREIAEVAKLYHVEIIPSFDSPGHMNYIVKKYNEHHGVSDLEGIGNYYHYNGKTAIVQGSRNKEYSRGIDISNETAVAFTRNLVTEYASFFRELGCTKFDIGGDELLGWGSAVVSTSKVSRWQQLDHWKQYAVSRTGNSKAVAYDGFMLYMNDLYDLVSGYGYTSIRMWNDDALRSSDTGYTGIVPLNKNIEIEYWTSSANSSKNNIWTYLNAGYKAYNYLNVYNYYILGVDENVKTNQQSIYNGWSPYIFDPNSSELGSGKNTALGNPNIKGSAFCIWCDNPSAETEEQVMGGALPMIRANGAKAWDALAHESVDYTTFSADLNKIGNVPNQLPTVSDIYVVADISALDAAIAEFSGYDASQYTEESFAAYETAVEEGKVLIASDKPTQVQVDEALAKIKTAQENLRAPENISDVVCMISGSFKSTTVDVGKVATLTVNTYKEADVVGFELYNELGNRKEFIRFQQNTSKADRNANLLMFNPIADEKGTHTYTAYAILRDGSRSADSMQFSLNVR